eukprot:TRINITY_DN2898_c0_g1_i2.p1 TRINITY_DN2898_c0_g1~~TRINITY_DN2898_c0_g1_i2.p1  ORF type:complete len:109 (+),score=19.70 TRINITY_DN2898_c0_g1_i2:109-435(+)
MSVAKLMRSAFREISADVMDRVAVIFDLSVPLAEIYIIRGGHECCVVKFLQEPEHLSEVAWSRTNHRALQHLLPRTNQAFWDKFTISYRVGPAKCREVFIAFLMATLD